MEYYGKELDWRIEDYTRGLNGIVSIEVVKPWMAALARTSGGLVVEDLPEPPIIAGFLLTTGRWKRTPDGGRAVSFSFEQTNASGGGGGTQSTMPVWTFSGTLYQRYIKTHPDWVKLKEDFGWNDDRKEFPDQLPKDSKADTSQWNNYNGGDPKLNPLRGVTSFDDYTGMLTKTYRSSSVPAEAISRHNTVIKKPWALLPDMEDNRDFKVATPSIEPYGQWFRIQERFELSGPGGWLKPLYKKTAKK